MRNWLLPEYIEDVMPAQAAQLESIRRQLLDLFKVNGYQYVIPPTLEFVESLLTGTAHDLDLATFKVVDQLTGRLMGLRADTTPQAARIDAHMLNHQGVSRLCYAGTVLRTNPRGLARSREPFQIGAELFGHAGVESDVEIQRLMIEALSCIGVKDLYVDYNHVGIFESLVQAGGVDHALESELYAALLSKDKTLIASLSETLHPDVRQALILLTDLNGGVDMLRRAEQDLPDFPKIKSAISDLNTMAKRLEGFNIQVGFDLSELRGYHYHSGLVFAAYAKDFSGALALGGRYDEVGTAFGRARPATGFSMDLRTIVNTLSGDDGLAQGVLAPAGNDAALQKTVNALREQGEVVIQALPNDDTNMQELNCNRVLKNENGEWKVLPYTE